MPTISMFYGIIIRMYYDDNSTKLLRSSNGISE